MNKKIISCFLVFILIFNFCVDIQQTVQAFALTGTTVGLLVFSSLLLAGGVYVSSKTDAQILYKMYLNTVDNVNDYVEWSKAKYATSLAIGKYIFSKGEKYVSSIVDFVTSHAPAVGINSVTNTADVVIETSGFDFGYNDSPYRYKLKDGDSLYFNLGDYQIKLQRGDSYLKLFVNGKQINDLISGGRYTEDSDKLKMNTIVTKMYIESSEYADKLTCQAYTLTYEGDTVRRLYFEDYVISQYRDGSHEQILPDVSVYNERHGIVGDGSISKLNNVTMPLLNVDEFGAFYDDARDVYTYPATDINSFVDALEGSGVLDTVLERQLELGLEGINSKDVPVTNVRENTDAGVVEWDDVYTDVAEWENVPTEGILRKIFIPSGDYDLDFSPLSDIEISDKFPFCIPFDFADAIRLFSSQAKKPRFVIDLDTQFFSVYHEIDLSPFIFYISFFRYIVVIWFSYILISKTRNFIKW